MLKEINHRTADTALMNLTLEQFGIDRLDARQRFELIGLIWDSIPDNEPIVPSEWHLRELERRVQAADADPAATEPWEDVFARLSNKP